MKAFYLTRHICGLQLIHLKIRCSTQAMANAVLACILRLFDVPLMVLLKTKLLDYHKTVGLGQFFEGHEFAFCQGGFIRLAKVASWLDY